MGVKPPHAQPVGALHAHSAAQHHAKTQERRTMRGI
jgi:hypothetical protein